MTYRNDINPQNDATCLGNARGKARRAKRHTAHRGRQLAQVDVNERITDMEDNGPSVSYYLEKDIAWGDADDDFDWDSCDGPFDNDRNNFEDMAKEYDFHHRFRK